MSIYRCNQCDEQKDNDIECLYDVNDKQISQTCVDDEVDLKLLLYLVRTCIIYTVFV